MDRVKTQDITLPIRAAGVRLWIRVAAQMEKTLHPSWQPQNRTSRAR